MNIGFSTGSLHGVRKNKNSNESLEHFLSLGCDSIELSCLDVSELSNVGNIDVKVLNKCKYKFLHAPALDFVYDKNERTYVVLDKILSLQKKYDFNSVGVHPDRVIDWQVFDDYRQIPWAIENMNSRKNTGKTINNIKQVLDYTNFDLLLDIQHCFSNDKTGNLIKNFYSAFNKKIVEIHVSGYTDKKFQHSLLYKEKQQSVITSIPTNRIPIIIESPIKELTNLKKELEYVKKFLVR